MGDYCLNMGRECGTRWRCLSKNKVITAATWAERLIQELKFILIS